MPRWDRRTGQGYGEKPEHASKAEARICGQCRAAEGGRLSLTKCRADGKLYCDGCWQAWNSGSSKNSGFKPREEAEQEPSRKGASHEWSRECAASDTTCHVSTPSAGSSEGVPAVSSASSSTMSSPAPEVQIDDDAALFSKAVARLKGCYEAEKSDDAEQQQSEELETLQEIYSDILQCLNSTDSRPRVLCFEFPTEVLDSGSVDIVVNTPNGEIVAGTVKVLPPVVLRCVLPARYPEEESPVFCIEAPHLHATEIDSLKDELNGIASENCGMPIIFMWASALQDRPPPPARLLLQSTREDDEGIAENMDAALELLAYEKSVQAVRRQREMQRCPVCFEEILGSRGLFLGCGHFGCRDCLHSMASIYTGEADLSSLRCPGEGCGRPFDFDVISELLGSDSPVLKRWEELSLQRCFDNMEDIAFCPRCDGEGDHVPCIQDEDHCANCEVCGYVFCGKCRCVFHPDSPCPDRDDQMWALEQRARGKGRDAEIAQAELLTLRHLQRNTRSCPKCSSTIEKSEGCNKMKCRTCGVYFCWKCNKEINGYDHFASSECRLFDDEEIKRWNQQMGANRAQARAHEAQFLAQFVNIATAGDQARECPCCKSVVFREGRNNHLRCFACWTPFCARCGVILPKKNAGDHFNRKGSCPQHSDD